MTALAYVGNSSGYNSGSSSTIATSSRSFTSTNHVLVWVGWEGAVTANSVTDTAGNTYIPLTAVAWQTYVYGRLFYCLNITGHATNVITCTFSGGATYRNIQAAEFSGVAASVTQIDGSAFSTISTTENTPLSCGSDSVLFAASSTYGSETTISYNGLAGRTFVKLTQPSAYSALAYAIETTGSSGGYVKLTSSTESYRAFVGGVIDSGNTPPTASTIAQISQLPVEILRTNNAVNAQVSQIPVEILRTNNAVNAQLSQLVVEILRREIVGYFYVTGSATGTVIYVNNGISNQIIPFGGSSTSISPAMQALLFKYIYEAILETTNSDSSPDIDIFKSVPKWIEIGTINKYSMFDLLRDTATVTTTEDYLIVVCGLGIAVNSLATLDLNNISQVIINAYTSYPAGLVYSKIVDVDSTKNIVLYDIPDTNILTFVITYTGTAPVSVGSLMFGNYVDIGNVQNGAQLNTLNFSSMDRDSFGTAYLIPRRNVPKAQMKINIDDSRLDEVIELKNILDTVPTVWSGMDADASNPYFNALLLLGIYKEFSFEIDNPIGPVINLELEEI